MRESRTYGSGRGACDETHVPTATFAFTLLHLLTSGPGRYCCKSLFALLIENSKGYRRDVRVNVWGTSSPDDKLVSDLAKATEAIKIAARRSDRLMARKLSPLNPGLMQQYLP